MTLRHIKNLKEGNSVKLGSKGRREARNNKSMGDGPGEPLRGRGVEKQGVLREREVE